MSDENERLKGEEKIIRSRMKKEDVRPPKDARDGYDDMWDDLENTTWDWMEDGEEEEILGYFLMIMLGILFVALIGLTIWLFM